LQLPRAGGIVRSVRGTVSTLLAAGVLLAVADSAAQSAGTPTATRRVTTDHLQVATFASRAVVTPGTPFALVFDIRPRERMHVYAPGADGYRIITVTLEPNPVLATKPLEYPASEIYHFEPIDERVPVFQKPFRLTLPLAISAAPEQAQAVAALDTLTIKGTLEYQACDDRICFSPKSVPVSYTIGLRPGGPAR
jgi:hypothetical protein